MSAITATTALWYASRATGVVALVLLTGTMALGIAVNRQGRLPGLPRFAMTSLHRSLSLLALAFVAVHVATAVADPYVSIRLAAAVIPFASSYQPFWLGIGALALDLMLALIITSLLRARIGRRLWRGLHWLAYAIWPVTFAHSIGSSTDMRHGALLALAIGCCVLLVGAAGWRLASARAALPRAERVPRALADLSAGYASPAARSAGPASGYARRSGQEAGSR